MNPTIPELVLLQSRYIPESGKVDTYKVDYILFSTILSCRVQNNGKFFKFKEPDYRGNFMEWTLN